MKTAFKFSKKRKKKSKNKQNNSIFSPPRKLEYSRFGVQIKGRQIKLPKKKILKKKNYLDKFFSLTVHVFRIRYVACRWGVVNIKKR